MTAVMSGVALTEITSSSASITPSITAELAVSPPAHSGPRMVASPPTERRTPWLNPGGERERHRGSGGRRRRRLSVARRLTLRLFRRDFGEEGHLGHGHQREAQQLEEDPDDEGRQLPPVATWRGEEGGGRRSE